MPSSKTRSEAKKRLELVKAYILKYWRTFFTSPTSREIADNFRTSTSVVATWLLKLENEGWIIPRAGPGSLKRGCARQIIPTTIVEILQSIPET
jgi:hypothetical protein